jgi:hypothetical protein
MVGLLTLVFVGTTDVNDGYINSKSSPVSSIPSHESYRQTGLGDRRDPQDDLRTFPSRD